jgi:hypothetical protein
VFILSWLNGGVAAVYGLHFKLARPLALSVFMIT